MGVVEEGLGGDAADVEACSTEGATLLNACNLYEPACQSPYS